MHSYIDAVIFDLDGVITDTAEYHFRAWKRLADEDGIPFTRVDNEKLRGVSRKKSLELLLAGRQVSLPQAEEMMARKNGYYREMLKEVSPKDLSPGVKELLAELAQGGVKIGIASASRNALTVVDRLGIRDRVDVLCDGSSVNRQKPAPDLFLHTARLLGIPPTRCLVVEDAASGIEAAQAAGMVTVGLGPPERVGNADLVLPSLENSTLADLTRGVTWRVSEPVFEPARQHHRETILNQGNGYLGTRGTFEERYPQDRQATLVHGFWDEAPIIFTELANAPNWTALDIWIDGQRFSMDKGDIIEYARYLDLRTGVLHRRLRWSSTKDGPEIDLQFERVPSLADPHVMVLRARIIPLDRPVFVEVRAMLDSHVDNDGLAHLRTLSQHSDANQADLLVKTRHTDKMLAMSTRVTVQGARVERAGHDCPGCPGIKISAHLDSGQLLTINKFVTIYTSRDSDDPMNAALIKIEETANAGYQAARTANDKTWKNFWKVSDVVIEGDDESQVAIRHALYQLRIAAPSKDERVSIGAKTLSGFGYRGHVFWDNEIFVLPFFTYTQPALARNLLMYRWFTLPGARQKAAANGFSGAQYAWESAETGEEVTPTWVPDIDDKTNLIRIWTGDIQIHISADVVYAMHQYWQVTGDDDFWRDVGVPILVETAVFWGERAEQEGNEFSIRDVIGPDEYHDHVDNNAFTNRLVQWHLETALEALGWLGDRAPESASKLEKQLDLTPARLTRWRRIIDGLIILQDPEIGLIEQFEGFFQLKEVDWPAYDGRTKSMQELLGIEGANQHQVLKQADVLMLLCLFREHYDHITWQTNWDYYNPRTDHSYGSSLSPAVHAWTASELGQPELAYEHFKRAARADLCDVRGNADDGIHAASAGGLWQAIVFGIAGLRLTDDDVPKINPNLPAHWRRLAFKVLVHGQVHEFDIRPEKSR